MISTEVEPSATRVSLDPRKKFRGSRAKDNIIQKELSKLIGISVTTISKYEKGERVILHIQAKKIGKALKITFKVFFA